MIVAGMICRECGEAWPCPDGEVEIAAIRRAFTELDDRPEESDPIPELLYPRHYPTVRRGRRWRRWFRRSR